MRIIETESGVKEIFLEDSVDISAMLGQFADDTMYDLLIDFDCDVYKPSNSIGVDPRDESLVLLKFRRNVFSKALTDAAYAGLESGATQSQNRGLAAGPREEKLNNRDWVKPLQIAILDCMMKGTTSVMGTDPIDDVIEAFVDEGGARGMVWLADAVAAEGFVWDDWLARCRTMSPIERKEAANRMHSEFISDTTYANQVNSGIGGYFDRYPRIPYCRATSYTTANKERFELAYPFIEAISAKFAELMPVRFGKQKAATKKIDPAFLIGESVYTTVTINKNFRTACHYDAGDLQAGFGNIVALNNGIAYGGANLVFPKYKAAVDLRAGDMLLFDPHELHGNTEIIAENPAYERVSIVLYFREKMMNCEAKVIEDLRYQFVESRRTDPKHPMQRDRWNGVSPDCFYSEEWIEFLLKHGMNEYVIETFGDKSRNVSLDDFF